MSVIKWYKEGEFTEENFSDKITIVKFRYLYNKFSENNGYRYVMGYFHEKTFEVIINIIKMNTVFIDYDKIEILPLSYTESINIKLCNKLISSPYSSIVCKYSELIEKIKESDIEFYREQ